MNQKPERQVLVVLPEASSPSEIEVLKLLSQAEIDLSSVRFVKDDSTNLTMAADDALVVVLVDRQIENSKVDAAILTAARAGSCHIVGVWAPNQTGTGIHPAAVKFTTAQIPWDPKKLRSELGSDCENAFETARGDVAEPNEIEPNECD